MSSHQDEHSSDDESFEIIDNIDSHEQGDTERSDDVRNDELTTESSADKMLAEQLALTREKDARIEQLEERVKELVRKCKDVKQERREELARNDETMIRMQEALNDAVAANAPLMERIEQLKALNGAAGDEIVRLKMENKQSEKANEKLVKRLDKMRSVDLTLLTTDEENRLDQESCFLIFIALFIMINFWLALVMLYSSMTRVEGLFVCFTTLGMVMCLKLWSRYDMPVHERKNKMRKLLQALKDCGRPIAMPTPATKPAIRKAETSSTADDVVSSDVLTSEADGTAVVELHRAKNGRFGLGLLATSVASVQRGSEADREGVLVGDEIISINGVDTATMSGTQIKKMMTAGKSVTLQFRHNQNLLNERKMTAGKFERKY